MVVTAHHIASPKSEMLASGLRRSASSTWNARCVTRQVEPPIKVDGWGPVGELRVWLRAEDGWWGLVAGRDGVRWMRAEELRPRNRRTESATPRPYESDDG